MLLETTVLFNGNAPRLETILWDGFRAGRHKYPLVRDHQKKVVEELKACSALGDDQRVGKESVSAVCRPAVELELGLDSSGEASTTR